MLLNFSGLGRFDLVFIDGDHSYPYVVSDTRNAFKVLRDDNPMIVWQTMNEPSVGTIEEIWSGGILEYR
jgi:hypothetical protein